jgi:hypothetical protein
MSETQKSWNQGDRVHPTKVRENFVCVRERGHVPPLHEYDPISRRTFNIAYCSNCHCHLIRRLAQRSLIHVLGGGALEILHKVNAWVDAKAVKSERHSSCDKSRRETEKEVLSGWRGRWGGSERPMQLLHEPVTILRGTFKVAYANNWHHSYVKRARWKELNPRAERWSIETLQKNNAWVRLESRRIREAKFARQK